MAKRKLGSTKKDTRLGRDLIAAAREAQAHKNGEITLPSRVVETVERASTE
jgi:hypothetical protein